MKFLALLLLSLPLCAQSPDAAKYAPRAIVLLDATPGVEAVMPMAFTENGQQHLEFIPTSKVKEAIEKGGKPIRLGDILAALNQATEKINQLQAENDRLWKVAMKDEPKPSTVVVQQSAPTPAYTVPERPVPQETDTDLRRREAIQAWLSLQQMNRTTNSTINLRVRDCTRLPALCVGK